MEDEWKIFGMIWNGRFQVWNGYVCKILPAMEDFHSIVCPGAQMFGFHWRLTMKLSKVQRFHKITFAQGAHAEHSRVSITRVNQTWHLSVKSFPIP